MDIVSLIESLLGLSALLGFLIMFYFYRAHKKAPVKKSVLKEKTQLQRVPTLEALLKIISEKSSTTNELEETVTHILKNHGKIPIKKGLKADPKFAIYSEIIIRACHHPNITKKIILKLQRELIAQNPTYRLELEDSLSKGLDTRSI